MTRDAFFRLLVPAWLATALTDGLFASALSKFGYHSTVTRLWQGVAATLLGPAAFDGGPRTALVGVVMHIGVALFWSTVFVALVSSWPGLRRLLASPAGVVAVAAIYGPLIWLVMSTLVIPTLTGRPPKFGVRWWIQCAGHVVFVALPMATVVARGLRARTPSAERAAAIAASR